MTASAARMALPFCVVGLVSSIAGCLASDNSGGGGGGISLSDLQDCDFDGPHGSITDCSNDAIIRPVHHEPLSPTEGWLCIDKTVSAPVEGEDVMALWYHRPTGSLAAEWKLLSQQQSSFAGKAVLKTNDGGREVYAWNGTGSEGWMEILAAPEQGVLTVLIYETDLVSGTPALKDAVLSQNWVDVGDGWWPIQEINAGGQIYYFNSVFVWQTTDGPSYNINPTTRSGSDFAFTLTYNPLMSVYFDYTLYGALNSIDCY